VAPLPYVQYYEQDRVEESQLYLLYLVRVDSL
jgi:hypothetical protein